VEIELRLDRYLLPASAVRQGIRLYSGDPANQVLLLPHYDAVERVLSFRIGGGGRLLPSVLYSVELLQPDEDPEGHGLRAFDGAGLEEGPVPLEWSFFTARAAPGEKTDTPRRAGCEAALQVLAASGCGVCHGAERSAMGLSLHSASALRSAVRRVAHQTDTGATSGKPQVNPARFGVGMPLLDPGSPGTSYLLYKLFRNANNFRNLSGACESSHAAPVPEGDCLAPPPEEQSRLEEWFVKLDPMPPEPDSLARGIEDLRTLQQFIVDGAQTTDCP